MCLGNFIAEIVGPAAIRVEVVKMLVQFYNLYAYCRWADDLSDEVQIGRAHV